MILHRHYDNLYALSDMLHALLHLLVINCIIYITTSNYTLSYIQVIITNITDLLRY